MEENTVLREDVPAEAIKILEIEGIANTSLEMVAERVSCPTSDLKRFWPDREALLYDALRYLSQQVDAASSAPAGRDLKRRAKAAGTLCRTHHLRKQPAVPGLPVYRRLHLLPGSSAPHSPAGGTAEAGFAGLHSRAADSAEVDDPEMVAKQMELIVEGCLSRLLVKRSQTDVDTARRLAEDILRFAQCRMGGALT